MSIIKKNNDFTTLINIFTVDHLKQQILVDMLVDATEQIMKKQEGFISSKIYRSLDRTKVINYIQWTSKESFEKMLGNPKTQIHMNDILKIAKLDGKLYDLTFTEKTNLLI